MFRPLRDRFTGQVAGHCRRGQGKREPWYQALTLQGHLRILALNGYAGFCDAFFILDNAGIEGSIVDLTIPLQAAIGATNGTPFAFELSRFQISPVRRERLADGVTIPLPRRIDRYSSVTNRNSYALATETRPPRVLSLPRTGGRKAACLRGGLVQGAGIWAGDASSPAQSSLVQRSSLPRAQICHGDAVSGHGASQPIMKWRN